MQSLARETEKSRDTEEGGRTHRDCPSCGAPSGGAELLDYSHPDWPMRRCPRCRLIYLEYVPVFARLFDELSWTRQHARNWERRFQEQPILARLDKWTLWRTRLFGDATPAGGLKTYAEAGPVLDVGCSTGKGFQRLARRFIPNGIEIDRGAAGEAEKAFGPRGGRVINADGVTGLNEFPDAYFSGVTLWGYLEHEARPRESLLAVRRVLRKDGVVLVKVPNFDCWNRMALGAKWPGFRHPDHVQYFTPATLATLGKACGFESTFRLYGRIPINDNLYAVLRPSASAEKGA